MEENQNYIPKYSRDEDPWEESSWQTGSTNPPKNRGGLVAVLLVLVIFLSGIVTVLGVLNVKLFRQLRQQEKQDELAISYTIDEPKATAPLETVPSVTDREPVRENNDLVLVPAPSSVDNAPQEGGLPLQEIYLKNIDSVVSISWTVSTGLWNKRLSVSTHSIWQENPVWKPSLPML